MFFISCLDVPLLGIGFQFSRSFFSAALQYSTTTASVTHIRSHHTINLRVLLKRANWRLIEFRIFIAVINFLCKLTFILSAKICKQRVVCSSCCSPSSLSVAVYLHFYYPIANCLGWPKFDNIEEKKHGHAAASFFILEAYLLRLMGHISLDIFSTLIKFGFSNRWTRATMGVEKSRDFSLD